jgi:predicted nucleic acid-binding protein
VIWLLDTNTIIYAQYVGGRVRERLDDASNRGRVVTSVLVIAELFYRAAKSSRPEANRHKVEEIARAVEIMPVSIDSAARFGALKQQLVPLVTNDGALLAGDIEGLVAENWI